jgi:hypothetical protein
MNRALSAVFHFGATFSLVAAVDGVCIAWKTRMNSNWPPGFANGLAASAAVFESRIRGCRPNGRGFGLLFHFSSVSTVTTVL